MSFITKLSNPQLTAQGTAPNEYATNTAILQDSLGNLYYVTMSQFEWTGAPSQAQPSLIIYKSTDSGVTWTVIVNDNNRGSDDGFGVSILNDIIIMAIIDTSVAPNNHLGVYQYNTATNTFLSDDYNGPALNNVESGLGQQLLSDGTLVMAYLTSTEGVSYDTCAFITWKSGVWGSPIIIGDGTYQLNPVWLIKEVTTDRVHLFLYEGNYDGNSTGGIWHVSLESDGTINTLQNIFVLNTFAPVDQQITGSTNSGPMGAPAILGNDNQIILPYVLGLPEDNPNPPITSVHAFRAIPTANPIWTDETVVPANTITGFDFTSFTSFGYFSISTVAQGGQITLVLAVNNVNVINSGGTFDAKVVSALYTTSTTQLVGGWNSVTQIFSLPVVGDNGNYFTSVYTLGLGNGNFGIVVGSFISNGIAPPFTYDELGLYYIGIGNPLPPPPPLAALRIQIFEDGSGEYLFNEDLNSHLCSGNQTNTLLNAGGAVGPFILKSPLPIIKPGMLTIQVTNVNPPNNPVSISAYVGLVFATPRRCGQNNKGKGVMTR